MRSVRKIREKPNKVAEARFLISRRVLNPILQPLGFVVLADHFYQPVLTDGRAKQLGLRHSIPPSFAAAFSSAAERLDRILAAHVDEFRGPSGPASLGYADEISQLGPGDREVLFAMLRDLKPKTVVEVGAGGSTLIIAAALAMNDNQATFVSVEPYPSAWLRDALPRIERSVKLTMVDQPLEAVGQEVFGGFGPGDVLFIDSSHVYRPGSDVEHEFRDVFPRLPAGSFLHVHDIFIPRDYPDHWNQRSRRYWNEQYYWEAVLANSSRYRPVLPLAYLALERRDIFRDRLGSVFQPTTAPGSLWLEISP